jgi:radical SAM protein with 4Fe4S-binding SPASM domain
MINLTQLYLGESPSGDGLTHHLPENVAGHSGKPEVVWNITRRCNLRCLHCYSDSEPRGYDGELDFQECKVVIDDLVRFGVVRVLLSGGEPLTHPDFFAIARYATERGLELALLTNGTLVHRAAAYSLKAIGFSCVEISLDGIGATHDAFRGHQGAFEGALTAYRNCERVGQKARFRLTLSSHTIDHLPEILDFLESENISGVSFHHLCFSGRGVGLQLVSPERVRSAMDMLLDRMTTWQSLGISREVVTVGLPADAVYLQLRRMAEDPQRAEEMLRLMKGRSGEAVGRVPDVGLIGSSGNVHHGQFWEAHSLGNVREKPFSRIWVESADDLVQGLRNPRARLRGRCAECQYLEFCGGGFRVRAAQFLNDPWAQDPGCYLTQEEVLGQN